MIDYIISLCHYFRDFFLEIFYFKNSGRQTTRCVVGKTTLYSDLDIKRLVVDPNFLPPGGNAKWACLKLLCFDNSQETLGEQCQ